MKEPGQMLPAALLAAENLAYAQVGQIHPAVESAIRADEAAKVRAATIEECAKVADNYEYGPWSRYNDFAAAQKAANETAAAIRAKIGAEHG